MNSRWTENVLFGCLGMRAGERVLALVDEPLRFAGEALCAAAQDAGAARAEVRLLARPTRGLSVVDAHLVESVRQADVIVSLFGPMGLAQEHAALRAAVSAFRSVGRGRWAMGAFLDGEAFGQELLGDWSEVAATAQGLAEQMRLAESVHVTTAAGTDLHLAFGGRPLHVETGQLSRPGDFGNLPGGEVYVAPREASAEGRLVVDLCIGDLSLSSPVTLTFHAGRVVNVAGDGPVTEQLEQRLGADPWAWTVGELGLGANPFARPRGLVTIDEKALGTAHIALGGNLRFGGANPAATHYDCVFRNPEFRWET